MKTHEHKHTILRVIGQVNSKFLKISESFPEVETTQMYINMEMNFKNVIYLHNGVLSGNSEGCIAVTCNNIDKFQKATLKKASHSKYCKRCSFIFWE